MNIILKLNLYLRPSEAVSTTVVAEITKAVATSIISTRCTSNGKMEIDAKVAATMATAAAQCAIVSIGTDKLLTTASTNSKENKDSNVATSPKKTRRAEDGWKEVTRRSEQQRSDLKYKDCKLKNYQLSKTA